MATTCRTTRSRATTPTRGGQVLLAHGIGPNWFPSVGVYHDLSMLQAAIMGHNLPVIKLLVERGADLNYVDPFSGSAPITP